MDFANLGSHCSKSTCKQIDFLPFTCKFCTQTFCLDHRGIMAHHCEKANIGDVQNIKCPICLKALKYDAGDANIDEHWNRHFETDCQPENYSKVQAQKMKTCMGIDCKTKLKTINTFHCGHCNKELCLQHRFSDKHECTKERDYFSQPYKQIIKPKQVKQPQQQQQRQQRQENRQERERTIHSEENKVEQDDGNALEQGDQAYPGVLNNEQGIWQLINRTFNDLIPKTQYANDIKFVVILILGVCLLEKIFTTNWSNIIR